MPTLAKLILVIATHNPDKRREINRLLGAGRFRVKDLDQFPAYTVRETGRTLADNALLKARRAARRTGHPALADDTGLEVSVLGGRPGVYSARFAGPNRSYHDNNRKLLRLLKNVPRARRRAVFRTAVAYVEPGGFERVFEGVCRGWIADSPRGTRGFGYDPVFEPAGEGRTFAQLSSTRKNNISHRGRAFRKAAAWLNKRRAL